MGCTSKSLLSNFGNEKCKDDYDYYGIIGKMCVFDEEKSNGNVEVDHPQPKIIETTVKIDTSTKVTTEQTPTTTTSTNGVERNLPHLTLLMIVAAYFAM